MATEAVAPGVEGALVYRGVGLSVGGAVDGNWVGWTEGAEVGMKEGMLVGG